MRGKIDHLAKVRMEGGMGRGRDRETDGERKGWEEGGMRRGRDGEREG